MARRVTAHNGRKSKNGVYNPNHNDRNFTTESDHIDREKSSQNFYWMCYKDCSTFEECEAKFYEKNFKNGLQKINEKHIKARNTKRVKTMDDYRQSPRTCPEEILYYIGNRKEPIERKLFDEILEKQVNWERETFPNVRLLDFAIHVDEPGADHGHGRHAFLAHDEFGNLIVNQKKALQEMGIERPDMSKPEGRYNNAKMTYTKQVRDHFIALCRSYGIEIEDEPREKSKSGLSLDAYKAEQIKADARQEADKIIREAEERLKDVERRENAVERRENALKADEVNHTAKVHQEAVKLAIELQEQEEREREQAKPARGLPFGGAFDI